jgi:hypothetical protein
MLYAFQNDHENTESQRITSSSSHAVDIPENQGMTVAEYYPQPDNT